MALAALIVSILALFVSLYAPQRVSDRSKRQESFARLVGHIGTIHRAWRPEQDPESRHVGEAALMGIHTEIESSPRGCITRSKYLRALEIFEEIDATWALIYPRVGPASSVIEYKWDGRGDVIDQRLFELRDLADDKGRSTTWRRELRTLGARWGSELRAANEARSRTKRDPAG